MTSEQFEQIMAQFDAMKKTADEQQTKIDALVAEVASIRQRVVYQDTWLIGWEEIAKQLGVSIAHAQRLGSFDYGCDEPIPVERRPGHVRIKLFVLEMWHKRWTERVALSRSLAHAGPRQGKSRDGSAS